MRRPGRFDREFLFPLPSQSSRFSILKIHTKVRRWGRQSARPSISPPQEWKPQLSDTFLESLAEQCVGYCGADLKALCTEAGLRALRRTYPQVRVKRRKSRDIYIGPC